MTLPRLSGKVALSALLLVGACSSSDRQNAEEFVGNESDTIAEYDLSRKDHIALKRRALAGDEGAAIRIAEYYELSNFDLTQSRRWWRIAALRGNRYASEMLLGALVLEPGAPDCMEGRRIAAAIRRDEKDRERARTLREEVEAKCRLKPEFAAPGTLSRASNAEIRADGAASQP